MDIPTDDTVGTKSLVQRDVTCDTPVDIGDRPDDWDYFAIC